MSLGFYGAALALSLLHTPAAMAQMCSLDGGFCDGGASDAAVGDGGALPDGGPASDGGATDAGGLPDGSVGDAGTWDASVSSDAGMSVDPGTVAACSCEVALNEDGYIHLCTGSFDRDTCESFGCNEGHVRSARCSDAAVLLCCSMPARRLYSQLYDDCTHANCESGFRAECGSLGGTISHGACDAPVLPDDPDTETTSDSGCSVHAGRSARTTGLWLVVGTALAFTRARRRLRS